MRDCTLSAIYSVIVLTASLLIPTLAAAGDGDSPAAMVLVSEAEIGNLEQALMVEVEKNRTRKCMRPVFSGKPTVGPADQKIIDVIEGELHRNCYQAVKEEADAVAAYLARPSGTDNVAPAKVVSACMSLPVAMSAAVQHSDACSPYLFGRRATPELLSTVRGGRALAVLIRHEGAAGNWKGAIGMALDSLRFYQDLNRGPGASLLVAMLSTSAVLTIINEGIRPLLEAGVPPDAEYQQLLRGLSSLLATDPPFCDALSYERYGYALQTLLPTIKGAGWVPPGGFDHGIGPVEDAPGMAHLGLAPGQEMALVWIAMDGVHERLLQMCSRNRRLADLYSEMRATSDEIIARPKQSNWRRILGLLGAKDPKLVLRQWIVEILQSVALPAFDKYVLKYAQRRFSLQGLRLQLLVASYSVANAVCPSLKGLEHPGFASATIDPGSGKPMVITFPENGTLRLAPAQETLDAVGDSQKAGFYQFTCPLK